MLIEALVSRGLQEALMQIKDYTTQAITLYIIFSVTDSNLLAQYQL